MTSFPDGSSPATSNVRGAEYPRVHPDLRVTFRLHAPNAQKVQVQPGGNDNGLGTGPFDMVRGEDGFWTVTTPPAVPGFHYYWLLVDGVAVNDPASETYFGYDRQTSGVEVPEQGVDFYDAQDVPARRGAGRAGTIRGRPAHGGEPMSTPRRIMTRAPGRATRCSICSMARERMSGGGRTQGRANFILDNLIAAGKARPMIVVMDCGYTFPVRVPFGAAPTVQELSSRSARSSETCSSLI